MKESASVSLTLDKVLVKRAKVAAAKMGTPFNVIVAQQLRSFLDSFEKSEELGNQNFLILAEFSVGVRSASDAMKALSIPSTAELNRLLWAAKLPKPTVSELQVRQMVETLQTFAGQNES